jgi:hypothetical protein
MPETNNNKITDRANTALQFLVAIAVIVFVGYCIYSLTHYELKDKNNSAFLIILGAVLGWGGALISFSFPGNIGGAKDKDTINKLASTSATVVTDPVTTTTISPAGE